MDLALSERPAGLVEYPVEVVLQMNERKLGADRGVVYFENGRLGFVGSSFSFLLAAEDFVEVPQSCFKLDSFPPGLTLKAAGGKAKVIVNPILGHGRDFRRALEGFFAENANPEGERQWPPLTQYVEPLPQTA